MAKKVNMVFCKVLPNAYLKIDEQITADSGKVFECTAKKAKELVRRGLVEIVVNDKDEVEDEVEEELESTE